jgi:hypothetical protein
MIRNAVQNGENVRNSLGVNYETAALPAELRRHERQNIASWQGCSKVSVIIVLVLMLMLMLLLVIEIVKRSGQYERLANLA